MGDLRTQGGPQNSLVSDSQLTPHQRWCFDQAAFLLGQSANEFLIASAVRRAEHILANHSHAVLTAADSDAIAAAVARGVPNNSALESLLQAQDLPDHLQVFSPVLKLALDLETARFDCGDELLNRWITREALASQVMGYADTYAIAASRRVVAFYSLAVENIASPLSNCAIANSCLPHRRMLLLLRLAVDREFQRQGLARAMIKDALMRFTELADPMKTEVLLVEAQDERAQQLYTRCGFTPGPSSPSLLFVALSDVRRLVDSP